MASISNESTPYLPMGAEYAKEYERLVKEYANASTPQEAEKIRALVELNALEYSLGLSDGDPNTAQLGGRHGDVKGEIKGNESHHLVPKSAVRDKTDNLTAVSLPKADHANTPSYGGRMGAKSGEGIFIDSPADNRTYACYFINEGSCVTDEMRKVRRRCDNPTR
jgi:hypothetical protein